MKKPASPDCRLTRMRLGVAVVSAVALLAWSGDALAKAPPPKAKELSAISQYRESIPGAAGPTLPGSSTVQTALPPAVERKVVEQGGPDAPALRKFAQQARFGAPARHALPPTTPRQRVLETARKGLPGAVFSGAGTLVTEGQDGRFVGLVVVMSLLAVAAVGLGVRRRAT